MEGCDVHQECACSHAECWLKSTSKQKSHTQPSRLRDRPFEYDGACVPGLAGKKLFRHTRDIHHGAGLTTSMLRCLRSLKMHRLGRSLCGMEDGCKGSGWHALKALCSSFCRSSAPAKRNCWPSLSQLQSSSCD